MPAGLQVHKRGTEIWNYWRNGTGGVELTRVSLLQRACVQHLRCERGVWWMAYWQLAEVQAAVKGVLEKTKIVDQIWLTRMIQSLKRALQWSRVRWHPRARFRDDGSPWDWVTSFWFGSAGSPRRPIPVLSICCFAKAVGTDVSSTQMRLVISTVVHRSDVDGHEQHWEMKVELI